MLSSLHLPDRTRIAWDLSETICVREINIHFCFCCALMLQLFCCQRSADWFFIIFVIISVIIIIIIINITHVCFCRIVWCS